MKTIAKSDCYKL